MFDRIKEVLGLSKDAELAWVFGISPQSLWNRKSNNSVPFKEAIFIAHIADVSLEYLLTGQVKQNQSAKGPRDAEGDS